MRFIYLIKKLLGMTKIKGTSDTSGAEIMDWFKRWMQQALHTVNAQLEKEIANNGFDPEAVKRGEIKLSFTRNDLEDMKTEFMYSIGNVTIMCVTWTPNSYTIHVRERADARRVKKLIQSGQKADELIMKRQDVLLSNLMKQSAKIVTKSQSSIITDANPGDINMTTEAAKMVEDFEKKANKLKIVK